ncbi:MAG: hypothetical protein ABFS37_04530 [Acidobacteriota bacterium]
MRIRILSLFVVLLLVSAVCSAALWEQWEWLNPRPQGHTLNGLAASHTLVVAVGEEGVILVSENGVDWDVVHSELNLILQDVTWTGDQFIAVGEGIILTSLDGRHWTESYVVGAMLNKVIFNGELILVVGARGKTVTSQDGVSWFEHELQNHPNSEMVDVAWNGSVFVGVGGPNPFVGADMAILFSEDGVSWTEASVDFLLFSSLSSVVWDSERFLVFGGSRFVLSSPDGVIWSQMATDLDQAMIAVIWTGDEYAGAGWGGQVALSNDGQSWSVETIFSDLNLLYDIVRFQGRYIVVGMDGAMAVSSDNGGVWTSLTTWEVDIGSGDIIGISSDDGILIAVSGSGGVFRSLDGLEWRLVKAFQEDLFSVQSFNDAFWAVGGNRLIAHSDDGSTWNTRHNEDGAFYADVATNGEVIIAGGGTYGGSAVVATSADGFAWDEIEIDGSDGLRIKSVTWSGTRFVGVGNQGTVFRSDDGYQWSFETLDSVSSLSHVVSNGTVLVAIGYDSSGFLILISDDHGMTWRFTEIDENVDDVIWTGDLFIAVGSSRIWSSRDGSHWVNDSLDFPGVRCVTGNEDELIGAGFKGWVMRAKRGRFDLPYHSVAELE